MLSSQSKELQSKYPAQEGADGLSQADHFDSLISRRAIGIWCPGRRHQVVWQDCPIHGSCNRRHIFASEIAFRDHKADILGRTAARLLNFAA